MDEQEEEEALVDDLILEEDFALAIVLGLAAIRVRIICWAQRCVAVVIQVVRKSPG